MDKKVMGDVLREFLKVKGLSQYRLAKILDCPMTMVNKWVNGHNAPSKIYRTYIKEKVGLDLNDPKLYQALEASIETAQPSPESSSIDALPPVS